MYLNNKQLWKNISKKFTKKFLSIPPKKYIKNFLPPDKNICKPHLKNISKKIPENFYTTTLKKYIEKNSRKFLNTTPNPTCTSHTGRGVREFTPPGLHRGGN